MINDFIFLYSSIMSIHHSSNMSIYAMALYLYVIF